MKFRVFDKTKQKFVDHLSININGELVGFVEGDNREQTNYLIQQKTNYIDVDGNEIYEGDVVEAFQWFDGYEHKPKKKSKFIVRVEQSTNLDTISSGGPDGMNIVDEINLIQEFDFTVKM